MNNKNKRLTRFLVLGMVAATPLAFAQTTPTGDAGTTQPPPATGAAGQQPAKASATGQGLSWADLDADGNGSLSKQEAQRHAGLANVFAQADADSDAELTADEYRAFVEKQQSATTTD